MEALSDIGQYRRQSTAEVGTGNNSHAHGNSADLAFDNLFPALVQCFAIIFIGYFAGRANLLSPTQGRGIALYVSKFAMPALLFQSMCKLHFNMVNWFFLASIFTAKTIVFTVVVLFTLLLVRPTDTGKMGIYGIFATQSHDFALGIPIVRALYGGTHPEYEQYLYLIAPISVAILNPIGFSLMEHHRWKHVSHTEQRSKWRALAHVLLGVVSNPIVFMTALGLVGNFLFHESVPGVLDAILKVLGDSFAATALFCLGHSMVGRIKSSERGAFFVITLLIAAKMLLSPFLIRELVTYLDKSLNETQRVDMSTYGFLYGAFPTAPSVFIYATHYSAQADLMATGMVVSTFLAAPLMFVSAKMITLPITDSSAYLPLITETAFDISIIGLICAIWVFVILIIHRRYHSVPHLFTMCLLMCQMLSCVGMILWQTLDLQVAWHSYVQFGVFFVGVIGTRCWTAMLATAICLLRARSLCALLKVKGWLCLYGFGIPVVLCGIVFITGMQSLDGSIDPFFVYGFPQRLVAAVALAINIIIAIVMLVIGHRHHAAKEPCNPGNCVVPGANCVPENGSSPPISIITSEVSTMTSSSLGNSLPPVANKNIVHGQSPLATTERTDRMGPSHNGEAEIENIQQPDENLDAPSITRVKAKARKVIRGRRRQRTESTGSNQKCGDCAGLGCGKGAGAVNIEDIVPDTRHHTVSNAQSDGEDEKEEEDTNEKTCLLKKTAQEGVQLIDSGCSPSTVRQCASLLKKYQADISKCPAEGDEALVLAERDEHQLTRHITLVLFLIAAAFVGLCLSFWKLFEESPSGVYVEMEFLDVVLTFGQAVFTFVVFGLDTEMVIEPFLRRLAACLTWCCPCNSPRWRRFVYRLNHIKVPHSDDLDLETKQTCDQFIRYHWESCQEAIEGEKRYRWRTYQDVFMGREMVNWLLEVGLVSERVDAIAYGRKLVMGGIIEHITSEHHFQDMSYLYRLTREAKDRFNEHASCQAPVNNVIGRDMLDPVIV